jgi:hypothetical protein
MRRISPTTLERPRPAVQAPKGAPDQTGVNRFAIDGDRICTRFQGVETPEGRLSVAIEEAEIPRSHLFALL